MHIKHYFHTISWARVKNIAEASVNGATRGSIVALVSLLYITQRVTEGHVSDILLVYSTPMSLYS